MFLKKLLLALLAVNTAEEFLHFHFAGELHDGVDHSLRARGTSRQPYIDGNNIPDTFGYVL